jgi:excisionase family DNA binding protein
MARHLTVKQTAEELNVSVFTIRSWINQRRLLHVRLGRAIRVPSTEIERLIESGTVPLAPSAANQLREGTVRLRKSASARR